MQACSAFAYSPAFIVCVIEILSLPLLCRINTERKHGGLGPMKIPLLADPTQAISRDYGVLKEDEGIAYRSVTKLWDKSYNPILSLTHSCSFADLYTVLSPKPVLTFLQTVLRSVCD